MITDRQSKEKAIIILKNIITILIILGIVSVLIFLIQGFRLGSNGEVQLTGLVQFASNISGSTVEANGRVLNEKTNTKELFLPGEYSFKISKEGYEDWNNRSKVSEGKVLWLNYARLIPKDKKVDKFLRIENLKKVKFSTNREKIFAISEGSDGIAKFWMIELGETPKINEISIPSSLFERESDEDLLKGVSSNVEIETITDNADRVLISWKNSDKTEFISLNTLNPEKSINISDKFHSDFSKMMPVNRAQTKFLSLVDSDLREVNIDSLTMTANLLTDIVDFEPYDENISAFVQRKGENNFLVGIFEKGKQTSTIANGIEFQPKIKIGRYHNENYLHIATKTSLSIYKGSDWIGVNRPKKIHDINLNFEVDKLRLNPEMRILVASNGEKNTTFDLETDTKYDISAKNELKWLDNFIFYGFEDDKIFIQDFDGNNKKLIFTSLVGFENALSHNGRYIYGFSKNSEGFFELSRMRMVLQ